MKRNESLLTRTKEKHEEAGLKFKRLRETGKKKNIVTVVIIILIILLCGPCFLQCLVNFVTQRLIAFSHVGDKRAKVQYISINDARYGN